MLRQVTDLFGITCDVELDVMRPNQSLSALTARLFDAFDEVVRTTRPDWVLVQGDTSTAFVAATVAFYHQVKVGHIEAGLRTYDRFRPFPEEVNRRFVDIVADAYFAPTNNAKRALVREHVPTDHIYVTGNTVVDAVQQVANLPYDWKNGPLARVDREKPIVLITAHRRESFGPAFNEICEAIRELAAKFGPRGFQFVYPVHLNPNVQGPVNGLLGGNPHILLLPPIDYQSLVQILKHSTLVLTDSGGIQEEAPSFHVPVCVMRDTTERPEGVEAGVARLVGTTRKGIVMAAEELLGSIEAMNHMKCIANPYGIGDAGRRIAEVVTSPVVKPYELVA
jgi:UDP-N-acetylglucosamine 2-epimerase